jgi:hypothetical protein
MTDDDGLPRWATLALWATWALLAAAAATYLVVGTGAGFAFSVIGGAVMGAGALLAGGALLAAAEVLFLALYEPADWLYCKLTGAKRRDGVSNWRQGL